MKLVYETTDVIGLNPIFGPAIHDLDDLWLDIVGHELHILHALDGNHSRFSRHYQGCAIDIRTWQNPTARPEDAEQIKGADREALIGQVRSVLGKNFWVLDHFNKDGSPSHFHISFKPENRAWTR